MGDRDGGMLSGLGVSLRGASRPAHTPEPPPAECMVFCGDVFLLRVRRDLPSPDPRRLVSLIPGRHRFGRPGDPLPGLSPLHRPARRGRGSAPRPPDPSHDAHTPARVISCRSTAPAHSPRRARRARTERTRPRSRAAWVGGAAFPVSGAFRRIASEPPCTPAGASPLCAQRCPRVGSRQGRDPIWKRHDQSEQVSP